MAKVKRIQFLQTFFEQSVPKYEAGRHYPVTPETTNAVITSGHAIEIEVEMDPATHAAELDATERAWVAKNRKSILADPALRERWGSMLEAL